MPDPTDQFLNVQRDLEKVRTPLAGDHPISTGDTALEQQAQFNPNEPETEDMGVRQEALRRSKVRQLSGGQRGQTRS